VRDEVVVVRRLASIAAVLLLTAATAHAQQMPDPRQMSGTPRPDAQVPLATTTVRVIHGELARNVEPGQPVHLVALHADGTATRTTALTDKEGRATFDKLATDGSVGYFAFALVGEDRLESDLIVLDKMAGVRLMLAGRKLDAQGQPIGPAIDDAQNADQPVRQPEGEAWVLIGGRQVNTRTEVELCEVPEAGQPMKPLQTTRVVVASDQQYIARFSQVPTGADKVYVARTKAGGHYYLSKPFMMKPGVGAGRTMLVYEQVVVTTHMASEIDDNRMRTQVQFMVQNFQGVPFDPGPDGLIMPLPKGAVGTAVADENQARVKVDGANLVWHGVIPPGEADVIARFALPIDDGVLHFELPTPLGLFQSTLVVEKTPDSKLVIDTPADLAPETRNVEGRDYYIVPVVRTQPGQVVKFTVTGLPRLARSTLVARGLAGAAVLLLIVAAVLITIFMPNRKKADALTATGKGVTGDGKSATARRKELTHKREQLYDELVALEKKRVAQQIDDDRYESTRQTVVSRLTLVLRELDQLDAGGSTRAS
jgi:hypothetical protein